jgi:hypothetical protein
MDQGVSARLEALALGDGPGCEAVLQTIAPHVDGAFYLARNPDVRAAGMPAAEHYWRAGWRERRDPSAWFHTEYYLRANPDVRRAELNPLWHYLVRGSREGRPPRAPGGAWRAQLEALQPAAQRPGVRTLPEGASVLRGPALARLLLAACAGARGLVVAFSHDRYTHVQGGTQLLIADEQRKFNGDGAVYVHLAPVLARPSLAPPVPATPELLSLTLDGTWHGMVRLGALLAAVRALPAGLVRLLVVHALHGLRPEAVADMAAVLRPAHAFFWAHDYGAACASPRLLRNDIAACAAPPPDALACRICIHGPERAGHRARLQSLFTAVPFRLAAPSALAAATWRAATGLPVRSVHVHPHAHLEPRPPASPAAAAASPSESPVRIAFVGAPEFHKGWGAFHDLLEQIRGMPAYRCFHFASPEALHPMDGLQTVPARTAADQPFGMLQALAAHRIELVLVLSPWPETFSYVAHEALAAGADLIVLEGSGHPATLVRDTGRGLVLPDAAALAECFLSGRAAAHVQARRAAGAPAALLRHCGSTATIALDAAAETRIADPDLHLLTAAGTRIAPTRLGGLWRFALPPAAGGNGLRLRSRCLVPAWEPDLPADLRRLGVAVRWLALDRIPLALADPRLRAGWHAPEPEWRWTDGAAAIEAGAARLLELRLAPMFPYWRAPLLDRGG